MPATVLTIGNFDGVHAGHRAIVRRAVEVAGAGGRVVAVTFDPPPIAVLRLGAEPPRLMDLSDKTAVLRDCGVAEVVVLRPTPEMLAQPAEAFVGRMVEQYHPAAFVEGADFRFGKGRAGDAALLRQLGKAHGYETHVIDKVLVALNDQTFVPVSSSLVRWLLAHGRVADAQRCLAAPYVLSGTVVTGEKRGRKLGVPTVNLAPAALAGRMVPADGVYAGAVALADGSLHPAAISVGVKPTFGKQDLLVEAHLLDFDRDLYGQRVAVRFHRWLRDQQAFPGLDTLRDQLARDVAAVRRWHEHEPPGTLSVAPPALST